MVMEAKDGQDVVQSSPIQNGPVQLQVVQCHSDLEEAEAYAKSLEDVQKDCVFIHETYSMLSQYVTVSIRNCLQVFIFCL